MAEIEELLKTREDKGLLRTLHPAKARNNGRIIIDGKEYIDLSSNDYLGFSSHSRLKQASNKAIEKFGTSSSASRLLSGDSLLHHELENKIASFKDKEAALVFNSGYQANIGIISALFGKGNAIFCDKLGHASIIDGILLSGARIFRFNHNDMDHLEALLNNQRAKFKDALIITETIFSMDGDRALLKELVTLKKRYNCRIMVDEAHATGIFGANGSGIIEEEDLSDEIDLIMGTFSKALGSFGAYLAASQETIDYLINTCRSFIYSTALPPSVIATNLASLDLVVEEPARRRILLENADYFRNELRKNGFKIKGLSQIIPLVVGDSQKAIDLSRRLCKRGYWALPIRPPTVPQGQARVRFSLTFHHTKDILKRFIHDICEIHKL